MIGASASLAGAAVRACDCGAGSSVEVAILGAVLVVCLVPLGALIFVLLDPGAVASAALRFLVWLWDKTHER